MKKILFVINTLGLGGAEKALLELLRRLENSGYEISLFVLLGQGELADQLPPAVKLLNKRYKNTSVLDRAGRRRLVGTVIRAFFHNGRCLSKLRDLKRNLADMRRTGRIQREKLLWRMISDGAERLEETYDLAVAWLEGGSAYYVAEHVKAVKKAAFIHIDYESAGYTPEMDQGCWEIFDRIFMVSNDTKKHFLAVYPECAGKAGVLHNLIDQKRIRLLAREPGGFSDSYEGMRLLTVGRLTYQKGLDVALKAMKRIKDRGYKARWYVLGEGDQRETLEKDIARWGLEEDFLLLGTVQNPYPFYRQADLCVHATRYEGKSIVIQEAQTLGCAILASDCDSNRQQIQDGVDGVLCELTPQAIAEGVVSLLEDQKKREMLGKAARAKEMTEVKEIKELLDLLD